MCLPRTVCRELLPSQRASWESFKSWCFPGRRSKRGAENPSAMGGHWHSFWVPQGRDGRRDGSQCQLRLGCCQCLCRLGMLGRRLPTVCQGCFSPRCPVYLTPQLWPACPGEGARPCPDPGGVCTDVLPWAWSRGDENSWKGESRAGRYWPFTPLTASPHGRNGGSSGVSYTGKAPVPPPAWSSSRARHRRPPRSCGKARAASGWSS